MQTNQPAPFAHSRDGLGAGRSFERSVGLDSLDEHPRAKGDKVTAARLAGFERTFVFKSRFVPLFLSRFFARIR